MQHHCHAGAGIASHKRNTGLKISRDSPDRQAASDQGPIFQDRTKPHPVISRSITTPWPSRRASWHHRSGTVGIRRPVSSPGGNRDSQRPLEAAPRAELSAGSWPVGGYGSHFSHCAETGAALQGRTALVGQWRSQAQGTGALQGTVKNSPTPRTPSACMKRRPLPRVAGDPEFTRGPYRMRMTGPM